MNVTRLNTVQLRRLATILVALISATPMACGSGSPTEPGGLPRTGLTLVFHDVQILGTRQATLTELLEAAFERARSEVSLDGLIVTVSADAGLVVPGWGVGGVTRGVNDVAIGIDPNASDELLGRRLPSIAAHEFHHVSRNRGPGYGDTLLKAMVSEGLADHFAFELFGEPLPPWVLAVPEADIDMWIERARPEFDSRSYDHAAWFFTGGSRDIPTWTGYTVGFRLVSDYQADHPGVSAADAVNLSADAFRPE